MPPETLLNIPPQSPLSIPTLHLRNPIQTGILLHNCGRCLRNADFPTKLELLQRLGIVAPSILTKYNRLRNVMEHEYVTPSPDQAEDVADIAELFLKAAKELLSSVFIQEHMRNRAKKQFPEVEKFPVHFYEDGIEQFETTLKIRQMIAMEHWRGNKNYSFYDVLKQIIPGFE